MEEKMVKNAFSKSLDSIFVGIIATCLSFSVWNLNYILPFFGHLLLLSELRKLKNINRFLVSCFFIGLLRMLVWVIGTAMDFTLLKLLYESRYPYLDLLFNGTKLILLILFLLNLRKGLYEIQKKVGTHYELKSISYLIASFVIFFIFPLFFLNLVKIELLTAYLFLIFVLTTVIFILIMLFSLRKELKSFHTLEDFVHLGKSRVSNLGAMIGMASLALLIVLAAHIHWRVYPMEWTEQKMEREGDLKRIEEELTKKGFPSDLIQTIQSEDLLACKGATRVAYETSNEEDTNFRERDKLKMHSIIVELPKEKKDIFKYRVFHFITWSKPEPYLGSDSLIAVPSQGKDVRISDLGGRISCKDGDTWYCAPFYSIEQQMDEMLTRNDERKMHEIYITEFSLRNHERAIAYLSYTAEDGDTETSYSESQGGYLYQKSSILIPFVTGKDTYLKGELHKNNYNYLYSTVEIDKP